MRFDDGNADAHAFTIQLTVVEGSKEFGAVSGLENLFTH